MTEYPPLVEGDPPFRGQVGRDPRPPRDAIVQRGIFQGTSAFLEKPFTAAQLTAKVREVMDDIGVAPVAA